jgi:hypothetical protein
MATTDTTRASEGRSTNGGEQRRRKVTIPSLVEKMRTGEQIVQLAVYE